METNTKPLKHGMDFGKLGRTFARLFGRGKNRREHHTGNEGRHNRFWLVGRGNKRNRGEQQEGNRRTANNRTPRLKPLVIRETPVGEWLRRFAPDILRAFADLIPAGFLLDSIAALIETRSFKPNERNAFDFALDETRNLAGIDVTKQWTTDVKSDSWLSKNVRPLVLLSLTLAFIVFTLVNAIAPQFFAMSGTTAGMFETLLLTVFGAYFAGRTIEKTMK